MAARPGRVTGKAARRNKWWAKRRNQYIAGGVLVALAVAGGVSVALDDDSTSTKVSQTPGDKWKDGIVADFGPMSQTALNYLKTINDWRSGKAKNAEVNAAADVALGAFLDTRETLADRVAFEQAPRALTDYRDSIELYIAHARLAKLGVQVTNADLKNQIELIMGRLRYLADRLYDLGGDELKGFTTENNDVQGFEYARTVDVPSFGGTDLAPGPPLSPAKPAAASGREYQETRPEQSFDAWKSAIDAAKIPSAEAEVKAIKSGTNAELDALAGQLTAASDALHAAPDPAGERVLSTRVQLGLLVQSEAMRAAQVAKLVDAKLRPEATEITQVLALLGNGMWDDQRLGPRDTGYPRTLITTRPKVAPSPIPEGTIPPSALPTGPPSPPPSGAPDASTPAPSPTG